MDRRSQIIDTEKHRRYVERFNHLYPESISNAIPDSEAWDWIEAHVPLLDCPDGKIEEIYYFRWWVYRKHIKRTEDGFVVTEFLPDEIASALTPDTHLTDPREFEWERARRLRAADDIMASLPRGVPLRFGYLVVSQFSGLPASANTFSIAGWERWKILFTLTKTLPDGGG